MPIQSTPSDLLGRRRGAGPRGAGGGLINAALKNATTVVAVSTIAAFASGTMYLASSGAFRMSSSSVVTPSSTTKGKAAPGSDSAAKAAMYYDYDYDYDLDDNVDGSTRAPALFNPQVFESARGRSYSWRDGDGDGDESKRYANPPIHPFTRELRKRVDDAMAIDPNEPYGLLHESHPPGRDAVMGLAVYPRSMDTFKTLVGGLRNVGYDGHIILGVHAQIPQDESDYLKRMDVTFYAVDMIQCDPSILDDDESSPGLITRAKCSRGLEDLKLEWGRFEMARQWLRSCTDCTGWAMVMDTRDLFFQSHPFASLPNPSDALHDLLFIEEISTHTCPVSERHRYYTIDYGRYVGRTEGCYGSNHWVEYGDRPVLCSGTVVGTRRGMHRFLSVLVDELRADNRKAEKKCRSPHNVDQWTMIYLYYQGRFGYPEHTLTLPWGTGPVLTIGHACINTNLKPDHSQKDLTVFENGDDEKGWILNNWELEGSKARRAPVVHQYDRCHNWVQPWLKKHADVYETERVLDWKK